MHLVLGPYGPETARHAVPYSLMQAGTYSRAFIEPSGLRVLDDFDEKNNLIENEHLDNYINISNLYIIMTTGVTDGEFLNSKTWDLLDVKRKTDSRGRINVNENNFGKEIRVFVSDDDAEPGKCKTFFLLPYVTFKEIRKSRIKDQTGEPVKVQSNGSVWLGAENKEKYVKVFVRK